MGLNVGGTIKRLHEFAGVAAFVAATAAAIGFSINPPWATPADFKVLDTRIIVMQRQQTNQFSNTAKQNCIILQLLRDRYLKEQLDAQLELNKNPESPTLQRARDEARANVEYLESEQRIARCRRLQAPISSSTEQPQPARKSPMGHSISFRPR